MISQEGIGKGRNTPLSSSIFRSLFAGLSLNKSSLPNILEKSLLLGRPSKSVDEFAVVKGVEGL